MENQGEYKVVESLIAKYEKITPRERKQYNEANTKNGFVQPLFEMLAWDFSDIDQVEAEKTIIKGRVDFIFKLDRVSAFCLEVKSLREDLTDNDRKQAISYAYNKGVTWAVLTNFDRLQIFNAERQSPDLNSLIFLNLRWDEYLANFNDLALLSKEAFTNNLLDKQAAKYGKLRLRVPVKERLYQHLRNYRGELFKAIYFVHKDKGLTLDKTDRLIQELFNRLLFIRTAEDRNLADNHPLLSAIHSYRTDRKGELIDQIKNIFLHFAKVFDSDLFPITFDPWQHIWINSDLLLDLIEGLYWVPGDFARYDFSLIDADVLGQVYEQYLGYVAQVVKERAKEQQLRLEMGFPVAEAIKLEEKMRKRKAAGIYYTPRWITQYIVEQTLGCYQKEHNYNDLLNIKIVDPACGSGSFLIRIYDELLNYHAKIKNKTLSEVDWIERVAILTNNIYGVDLDGQAVEITRLNLLLRALAKAELLPSLANNIQCGNSLISGTEKELLASFGKHYGDKRPFNWTDKFPEIMNKGGFDIVIGNPPYVNESRGNKEIFRELKKVPTLKAYYEKNMDLFNYFIEIGLDLLKENGFLGYIIPSYWQDRTSSNKLRQKIVSDSNIEHLVDLKEFKVFEGAPGQHNNIIILRKVPASQKTINLILREAAIGDDDSKASIPKLTEPKSQNYSIYNGKLLIGSSTANLIDKLNSQKVFYLRSDSIMRGVDTGPSTYKGRGVFVLNKLEYDSLCQNMSKEVRTDFFKPFYRANQIDRYYYDPVNTSWLLYTDSRRKKLLEGGSNDVEAIIEHLNKFKHSISSDNKPYGLHRPKSEDNFLDKSKILFVRKTPYPKFVPVEIPYFVDESSYLIIWHNNHPDIKFITAVLNSSLAKWWFGKSKKHGEQLQIDKEQITAFPLRIIDIKNSLEKENYVKITRLANRILELKRKQAIQEDQIFRDKIRELQNEIAIIERNIDELVYHIYGLTKTEIRLTIS